VEKSNFAVGALLLTTCPNSFVTGATADLWHPEIRRPQGTARAGAVLFAVRLPSGTPGSRHGFSRIEIAPKTLKDQTMERHNDHETADPRWLRRNDFDR
jgi:hypothetical protein